MFRLIANYKDAITSNSQINKIKHKRLVKIKTLKIGVSSLVKDSPRHSIAHGF